MSEKIWDAAIIGGGPAGLSAGLYTSREGLSTLILESKLVGGMMTSTDRVDNYPGFNEVKGLELSEKMEEQAKAYGAVIGLAEVNELSPDAENYKLTLTDGREVKSRSVLIAVGNEYLPLNVPGEKEMSGRGVHFCATCDGAFYSGKDIAVIGGGNSAIEESIFLTRFAKHIDLIVRSTIKASQILQDELAGYIESGQITVHLGATVSEIIHDEHKVTGVKINANEEKIIDLSGVFVFIGLVPNVQFLQSAQVKLDGKGFLIADENNQTNLPGVFVAGDVRSGAIRQIATACGDGVKSALAIRDYLNSKN